MKAAVLWDYNTPLKIEDLELHPPRRGEVQVRIGAAGICRSDLHIMKGEARFPVPCVLGHEGSAVVEQVGEGVTAVRPGDHVILSFAPNCGFCFFCETGRPHLCETSLVKTRGTMFDGTHRLFKGEAPVNHMGKVACFAEQAVVPESGVIPLPKDVPLEVAALIGCSVTTGVGAVMLCAKVEPGSTVAVVGCGGVGLNVVQGAKLMHAAQVIAVDLADDKLEFTTRFGATHTVNARYEDPVARIRELTDGRGVDYAFEVFGSSETARVAYEATRRGGTTVIVGLAAEGETGNIELVSLVRQEKTVKGCYYGSARPRQDMPRLVELYRRGALDVDGLITRRYKLEQINEAYEDLDSGKLGRGVIVF